MVVTWGTAPYVTEGFLLDEEAALKDHLVGMKVTDIASGTNGRTVGVWYAHPDKEDRDAAYPYGVISLIDITPATERLMAGRAPLDVVPDWVAIPAAGTGTLEGDLPTPVNLDFQLQYYSRNPRHSRSIISQMLNYRTPLRGGRLKVIDGTYRRMDLIGTAHRESDESNKRLFVETFTVRVSSEMTPANINNRVTTPAITKVIPLVTEGIPGYL